MMTARDRRRAEGGSREKGRFCYDFRGENEGLEKVSSASNGQLVEDVTGKFGEFQWQGRT